MKINGMNFNPAAADASLVAERTGSSANGGDAFAQLFAAADRAPVTKAQRIAAPSPADRKPSRESIESVERDESGDDTDPIASEESVDDIERRPRPSRPDADEEHPDTSPKPTDESAPADGAVDRASEIGPGQVTTARESTENAKPTDTLDRSVEDSAARLAALRQAVLAAEGEFDDESVADELSQTPSIEAAAAELSAVDANAAAATSVTESPVRPVETVESAQAATVLQTMPEAEPKIETSGRPLFTTLADAVESVPSIESGTNDHPDADARSRDDAPRPQPQTSQQPSTPASFEIEVAATEPAPHAPTPESSGPALIDDAVKIDAAVSSERVAATAPPASSDASTTATPTQPSVPVEIKPIAPASVATVGNAGTGQPTAGLADIDGERVAEQAMRGLRGAIAQKGGGVTLRLNPGELGQIKVHVDMHNGVVKAQIHTATDAARTLLQQQIHSLKASLEGHGLTVESLNVTQASQSSGSSFAHADDQTPSDGRSRGFNASQQQNGKDADDGNPDAPDSQPPDFDQQLLDLVA